MVLVLSKAKMDMVQGEDYLVPCDLCSYEATGTSNLKQHMTLEHGIKLEGEYQCNMCDYATSNLANFKRHMGSKTHEGAQMELLKSSGGSKLLESLIKSDQESGMEYIMEYIDKYGIKGTVCKILSTYVHV